MANKGTTAPATDDDEVDETTSQGGTAADAGNDSDPFDSAMESLVAEALAEDGDGDDAVDEGLEGEDAEEIEVDDELDAEEEETGDAGAQPRNDDGTFAGKRETGEKEQTVVAGDTKKEGETKPDAKPDAAAGAAAGDKKPAEQAAAAPTWEPLSINADKQAVAIDEARISRSNGHVFLAIPEAQYQRFAQRISKGVVGERMSRQLDQGLRQIEALKAAPPMKSDAEIEAALTYDALKPYIAEFLDEKDIKLLEAQITNAKRENRDTYEKTEAERMAKAIEPQWEETQLGLLRGTVVDILKAVPELQGLTREQVEDVLANELLPVKNSLVFREGQEVFGNTEYILARLKARVGAADAVKAAPAAAGAPAPSTTPATAGTSSTTATKAAANAERFNAGVTAGRQVHSTSVKGNRGKPRSATRGTRDTVAAGRRTTPRDEQVAAEDDLRKTQRRFMNSNSLDIPDDEDEE
jgi:hypothetical protein